MSVDTTTKQPARARDSSVASVWADWMAGEWTLVEQRDLRDRQFMVLRSIPAFERPLTQMEKRVILLSLSCWTERLIAEHLGMRPGTVSSHLSKALRKLGIASRLELVRICNVVLPGPPHRSRNWDPDETPIRCPPGARLVKGSRGTIIIELKAQLPIVPASLSPAQLDVAMRAFAGASIREIALARGVRPKTISNQLDATYRKLGVGSRIELYALLAGMKTSAP